MTDVEDAIERAALIRVLQDAVWPFLEHDPHNPDVFWRNMADRIEEHFTPLADEVKRLRAVQVPIARFTAEGERKVIDTWEDR